VHSVFFCWGWGRGEQAWAWKAGFVGRKLMMMMMRVGVAAENAAKELQCTDIR